jgi:L-ornithine N5-monooxygenase
MSADRCESILDTVGIGFGPSNIALAVAHEESGSASSVTFFEANSEPTWQPGMRMDGADIQHNPLRDFITPLNPCSKYGYLSYLKAHGRLFHFLNLDARYPPRSDYEEYIRWVARAFADEVHYAEPAVAISLASDLDASTDRWLIRVDTPVRSVWARSLVFAPGRSPHIPQVFQSAPESRVLHFTGYADRREDWRQRGVPSAIAVVGASQSAVEILLDLRAHFPEAQLHCISRSFAFVLKDTSPFTEDLLFPSFTDYFYEAPPAAKRHLVQQLVRSNYGSVDHDVLSRLYFVLYDNEVRGDTSLLVHNNSEVVEASIDEDGVELFLEDIHTGHTQRLRVDTVILATGFRNTGTSENEERFHPLLANIVDYYERSPGGTLQVTRDYRLVPRDGDTRCPPIFLNGLCECSHGLGDAGSFSLLSYRAHEIERGLATSLTGRAIVDSGDATAETPLSPARQLSQGNTSAKPYPGTIS